MIAPVFSEFCFTSWSLDDDLDSDLPKAAPELPQLDDDFAFDVNAVPEPVPSCAENENPVDNFEGDVLNYICSCITDCFLRFSILFYYYKINTWKSEMIKNIKKKGRVRHLPDPHPYFPFSS